MLREMAQGGVQHVVNRGGLAVVIRRAAQCGARGGTAQARGDGIGRGGETDGHDWVS
jgi:hypothetical protein